MVTHMPWTFPARHNLSLSLAMKLWIFNSVPDRWFKLFRFFSSIPISNHFAHIAKLALKKGKELLCCINIPPELLAVKGRRKTKEIKRRMIFKSVPLNVTNV